MPKEYDESTSTNVASATTDNAPDNENAGKTNTGTMDINHVEEG